MLNTMRSNLKALSWLLWLVVASFVIAIFVEWGRAGDAARADATATWMARVDGRPITIGEYQDAYFRFDRFYRQIYREQYDPRALGIARLTLNQLIRDRLVLDEARRVGLRVSPDEISAAVTSDPTFQQEGQFIGVDEYRRRVEAIGFEITSFEHGIAEQILRDKYRRLVTAGVTVAPGEVEEDYRRRNETVAVDYLLLPDTGYASGEAVPEDAVRAYYETHPGRYRTAERRRGSIVILETDRLPDVEEPTEDEARAYYEQNRDRLYTTTQQVRASHILLKIPEGASPQEEAQRRSAAEALLQRIRQGADFAALAREHSEDTTAPQGGDLGYFGRGRMVAPFEEAAFSLPVGGTSEVIRTDFGFHILRVTDRRDAGVRPFAEVRDGILRQLRFSRAEEALSAAVAAFRDEVERDPAAFDAAATRLGLQVQDTGALASGDPLPGIGAVSQLSDLLFRTDAGRVTPPVRVPQGTAFVKVEEVMPPAPRPLEEVRAEVEMEVRRERALERARERAGGDDADLAAMGKILGAEVQSLEPFRRGQPAPPLDAAAQQAAFAAAVGTVSGPLRADGGLLLFEVRERAGFDPEAFAAARDSLARSLAQQHRQRLFDAVVDRLESAARVEVNQARMEALERRG